MGVYFGTTEITNVDWIPGDKDITQVFFAANEVFSVWAEYDGTLPAQYTANGDYLADYRIYGAAGGVGDYVAPEYKQVHTDTVTIDGIVWDILGYDHDTVYKSDNTIAQHSVTIQAHDVLLDMQFDAKEALFAFDSGLAAGTYHFTVGAQPWYSGDVNKTIQFTLAQALPAGGQLMINCAYNTTMVGATISAFASGTATTATETVTMSEGSDGTDIGTVTNGLSQNGVINSIQRALLGSNKWSESCIRQYLNSSASAGSVWEPKNKWDRPPAWVANTAGFLNGMSTEFKTNLGTTSKTTALNNVTDGGGVETTFDKVFLLSRSEVYAGNEATGDGTAYPYYSDFSDLSAPGTGADGNRIKNRNGAAKYWWTRSPHIGTASIVRYVSPSGTLTGDSATNTYGIVPACCIPLDNIETNDWLREKFLKNPSAAYGYEVNMSVRTENLSPLCTEWDIGQLNAYGELVPQAANEHPMTSDYIPVATNETYTFYMQSGFPSIGGGYWRCVCFYDSNKDFISPRNAGYVNEPLSCTAPANAAYARLSCRTYETGLPIFNVGSTVPASYIPYYHAETPIYIGNTPLGEYEYVDYGEGKIYRMSGGVLTPTDPPVPLPALPTVDGTNIVDYAGQSAAVPSRFVAKYRKEGF